MLVAYIETAVPVFYSIYLIISFHLPNCKYYQDMQSFNTDNLQYTKDLQPC